MDPTSDIAYFWRTVRSARNPMEYHGHRGAPWKIHMKTMVSMVCPWNTMTFHINHIGFPWKSHGGFP